MTETWARAALSHPGGRKHVLVFTGRMLVALVHLRTELPYAALAELDGVGRSTSSTAASRPRRARTVPANVAPVTETP